jgi:N-acetylneuraminic acid mutarotase
LNHAGVTTYEGKLYTFGGLGPIDFLSKLTLIYDPATDNWSEGAPLPLGRVAPAAATLGDYLYVLGGYSTIDDHNLRYDPHTDRWSLISGQPTRREHVAAVAFQDEIWLIGGRWQIGDDKILNYSLVEIYNPQTDTWRSGPALNDPRAGFGAVVLDGKIYVLGGELLLSNIKGGSVGSVEVYDPAVGKWQVVSQMPVAMHGIGTVAYDGKIYVISGSDKGGTLKPARYSLVYTP